MHDLVKEPMAIFSAMTGDKFIVDGEVMVFAVDKAEAGYLCRPGDTVYLKKATDGIEFGNPEDLKRIYFRRPRGIDALMTRRQMYGYLYAGDFDVR